MAWSLQDCWPCAGDDGIFCASEEYEESLDVGKSMLPVDRGLAAGGDFAGVGLNKGATVQDFCADSVFKTGLIRGFWIGIGA